MRSAKRKLRHVIPEKSENYDPADAPEFFNGCKFWRWMEDINSGRIFPMPCGVCDGCRLHKHESLVGRLMAEGESSAAVLSVCLTYRDDEKAEWLDYDDVKLFLMRLRKAGYKLRKFAAGEYGTRNGRAHWHLLLFFQWDAENLQSWIDEQIYTDWKGHSKIPSQALRRRREWLSRVPPILVGAVSSEDFKKVIADPERLWVPTVGFKSAGDYPQEWKFWKHGHVQAKILKAPGVGTDEEMNRGVRYDAKYFSKDPWKDGKTRNIEFERLPEWIKQATAYGPWQLDGTNARTKWVRGNQYGKDIDKRNLEEYASDDDVPKDKRRKVHRHIYKCVGGLGADYFKALGAWYAHQVGSDEKLVDRTFKLGPSYRKKHIQAVRKTLQGGELPAVQKRNPFYMGDTAFRRFGEGFNLQLEKMQMPSTQGPDFVFDNLESIAIQNSDQASGPFGFHMWKNATGAQRKQYESLWAEIPNERLAGLIPQRLIRFFEDTSKVEGWQLKRRQRLQDDKQGKTKTVTRFGNGSRRIIETTQKRWFYERDLKKGDVWWRRELLTVENLEAAFEGTLLPENARAARLEREGKGDQKLLSELDIRTVRKHIKNAWASDCPF